MDQPQQGQSAGASDDPRAKIVDALMQLAAEKPWDDFTLSDVAARAGVTLTQFRDLFPSKGAVLGAFSRRIDKIVLDGSNADLAGEPAKERLFDVLMRRFDALAPYKPALAHINDWALRDPLALGALNQMTLNSLRFMLEAAGIDSEGPVGALKLQGLALTWAHLFNVWLNDDTLDQAATMAALDKDLSRGETLVARAEQVQRFVGPLAAPLQDFAQRVFLGARRERTER